jgi:hypothetical protein
MSVISEETISLIAIVRENYPKTWEWVRHKANQEHMCVGAVFKYYYSHIEELMEEEKFSV